MENLGIDLKLLIAQLINFGLFFFIFYKFISKPFLKFLNEEKKKDLEKQKSFDEIQAKELAMTEIEEKTNEKMSKELNKAIQTAKVEAEKVRQELVDQAKNQAEDIVSRAKKQIEIERDNLYKEMKQKIADVSILIVKSSLKDFLTEEVQRDITKQILKNLPAHLDKYEN